jgi:hypothetical protein
MAQCFSGSTTNEGCVKAALVVLQQKQDDEDEEDRDRRGDGSPATGRDVNMTDDTRQTQATDKENALDEAFETLVRSATEESGFAPRDVCDAVFNLPAARWNHANAMKSLYFTELKDLVINFSVTGRLDLLSQEVIAIQPIPSESLSSCDEWAIDLKSTRIARKVVELLWLKEMNQLREMYILFDKFPDTRGVAGRVFEAMIHRKFSSGWKESVGPMPHYFRMDSTNEDPPTFSTDPPSDGDPSPAPAPLSANAKKVIEVNLGLKGPPGDVTLNEDRYYVPAADNGAPFDSFMVHYDSVNTTFVISIIQITLSEKHGGAAKGYLAIRRIMKHVKELVKKEHPGTPINVKVVFVLVCPKGGRKYEWNMAVGWGQKTHNDDHRGAAFCLRVPTPDTL